MDMKNTYSPAMRHFRGHLMSCPNPNSVVPGFPTSTMRRSLRWRIMQRRCWKTSLVSEPGSCRHCHASSVGVHGAQMTRTGRDRQREKLEHQRLLRPEQIALSLFEFLLTTCECSCLCARVMGTQKERTGANCTVPLCFVVCVPFLSSLV